LAVTIAGIVARVWLEMGAGIRHLKAALASRSLLLTSFGHSAAKH
jgi:hypothetical protein